MDYGQFIESLNNKKVKDQGIIKGDLGEIKQIELLFEDESYLSFGVKDGKPFVCVQDSNDNAKFNFLTNVKGDSPKG